MDQGAIRWLHKTVRLNFWRVAAWYEPADLVQDGFLTYYRIARHYRHVTDKAHLMRLFQIAFTNHLHRLATLRTRSAVEVIDQAALDHAVSNDGELVALIAHAPKPVKAVLVALGRVRPEVLRAPYRRYRDGRETTNQRLCRIASLDPTTDIVADLYNYLSA